ncbi:MAG: outer membrane lipoprotein carrier protein LolA [Candidatus Cryptobacteroides sp.]
MKMKLAAVAASLFLIGTMASGADNDKALKALEQKNASLSGFQGDFRQTKTLVNRHEIKSCGTLYFAGGDKMSMIYSEPSGETFVINGDKMSVNREGKANTFDLTKNKLMNSLAVTLLYSLQGRIADLSEISDADIEATQDASGWHITLTARKKAAKGYSRIDLRYKSDGSITYMKMTEFSGISTTYEMPTLTRTLPSDPEIFSIR